MKTKNPTIEQYENDLKNLQAEKTALLKIKKVKKEHNTDMKTPLRDMKALEAVTFKINVTKTELNKLYLEANNKNRKEVSANKVKIIEKKNKLDKKVKAKK